MNSNLLRVIVNGKVTNGEVDSPTADPATQDPSIPAPEPSTSKDDFNVMLDALNGDGLDDSIKPEEKALDSHPQLGGDKGQLTSPSTGLPSNNSTDVESKLADITEKYTKLLEEITALKTQKAPETPVVEEPPVQASYSEIDYVGDIDPYDVSRDKESLNKLLNTVAKNSYDSTMKMVSGMIEKVVSNLDTNIVSQINKYSEASRLGQKFYVDNADLEPHKAEVAESFKRYSKVYPESSFENLLQMVETDVRVRMNIPKKTTSDNLEYVPPKLPPKPNLQQHRQSPPSSKSAIEQDIAKMAEALEL